MSYFKVRTEFTTMDYLKTRNESDSNMRNNYSVQVRSYYHWTTVVLLGCVSLVGKEYQCYKFLHE